MKLNNNDDSHNSGLNLLIYNMLLDIESHPAWVCGLKRLSRINIMVHVVTPCVGVWIETIACNSSIFSYRSHPAWVCGLKLPEAWNTYFFVKSHPAWVCGLKLYNLIERTAIAESHPAWVCGLKPGVPGKDGKTYCHTLRGCVD